VPFALLHVVHVQLPLEVRDDRVPSRLRDLLRELPQGLLIVDAGTGVREEDDVAFLDDIVPHVPHVAHRRVVGTAQRH